MEEEGMPIDEVCDRLGRKIIANAPDGIDVILIFAQGEEVTLASNITPVQIAARLRELAGHLDDG